MFTNGSRGNLKSCVFTVHGFALLLLSTVLVVACQQKQQTDPTPPMVEVIAQDYVFKNAPDTLDAGWTSFRLINKGKEPHFFILDKMPEGKGLDAFMEEIAIPFDSVWYKLRDGTINKQEAGKMLAEKLPKWFGSLERWGGTGIINAGEATQTTINLAPGTYIMECYIKNPEGEFHVSMGMAREIYVTRDTTDATAPKSDVEITLTNNEIKMDGSLTTGNQRVAVHFEEHPKVGLGNDLHLARINDTTNVDSLKAWMDWMEIDGLKPPAPATFLGGTQEMPVGHTSYFTIDLQPGEYAWLTETLASQVRAKTFSIKQNKANY